MPTALGAFTQSRLGAFIQSELGQRGVGATGPGGIYCSIFPGTTGTGVTHGQGIRFNDRTLLFEAINFPDAIHPPGSYGMEFGSRGAGLGGWQYWGGMYSNRFIGSTKAENDYGIFSYNGQSTIISDINTPPPDDYCYWALQHTSGLMLIQQLGLAPLTYDGSVLAAYTYPWGSYLGAKPFVAANGDWWFSNGWRFDGTWHDEGNGEGMYFEFDGDIHCVSYDHEIQARRSGTLNVRYGPLMRWNGGAWDIIAWLPNNPYYYGFPEIVGSKCYFYTGAYGNNPPLSVPGIVVSIGPDFYAPIAADVPVQGLIGWSGGNTFDDVGGGITYVSVIGNGIKGAGGNLYMFGNTLTDCGGTACNGAAYWDGAVWTSLGNAMQYYCDPITGSYSYPQNVSIVNPVVRGGKMYISVDNAHDPVRAFMGTGNNYGLWCWDLDALAFIDIGDMYDAAYPAYQAAPIASLW